MAAGTQRAAAVVPAGVCHCSSGAGMGALFALAATIDMIKRLASASSDFSSWSICDLLTALQFCIGPRAVPNMPDMPDNLDLPMAPVWW